MPRHRLALTVLAFALGCGPRAAPGQTLPELLEHPPMSDEEPAATPGRARSAAAGLATPASPSGATDTAAEAGVATPIFDPSQAALAAFHGALARTAAGHGQARIAFYGASHTAADLWTGHVRRRLQSRYGDAGHGFLLPVVWHGGYRHQDIVMKASTDWQIARHKLLDPLPVGDFGYAGVTASSSNSSQWMLVRTTADNPHGRRADTFEVWYRSERQGGTLQLIIDGTPHAISTRGSAVGFHAKRFALDDGGHEIRLAPAGDGRVTLYGVVVERSAPGVILDQLGIPGMRGRILLSWRQDRWRAQVARRNPQLVVLAYGTNAAGDHNEPAWRFRRTWRNVIERVRAATPAASCLIIGPTDRPLLPDDGGIRAHRPHLDRVIAVQKEVAAEMGCGYWDAFAAMGAVGSMNRWVQAGLAASDHVHLTRTGYERLADLLVDAMLAGCEGCEPTSNPAVSRPAMPTPRD